MLRRHTWRWLAVAMLASFAATAAIAPTTASATTCSQDGTYCPPPLLACPGGYVEAREGSISRCVPRVRTAALNHVGWTYHVPNHCPDGAICAQGGGIDYWTAPAWSWRNDRWNTTRLSAGWVYVYPYSGQWRWAWTQASGWVAVSGSRFEIRAY